MDHPADRSGDAAPIRVLCIEDHAVVREGIGLIIDMEPGMTVVGSAASGEEGVALHRALRPDITLMDLELPGIDGIEAIQQIHRDDPRARVIVLTMHHDPESIQQALQAGATTYVLKDTISKVLIEVLREVHEGGRPMPEDIAAQLAAHEAQPSLTPREVDVIRLISQGLSNKEVAAALRISDDTVRTHLKNLFTKLEVTDRTAAVMAAVRRGVVRVK
jgi:DNA-binding NarL/FixJ family response regulator